MRVLGGLFFTGGLAALASPASEWRESAAFVWSRIEEQPLFAFLMLAGLAIISLTFSDELRPLVGLGRWRNQNAVLRVVTDWLDSSSWAVTKTPKSDLETGLAWKLSLTDRNGVSLTVMMTGDDLSSLAISGRVVVSDDLRAGLDSHSETYLKLQDELAIELAKMGVAFSMSLGERKLDDVPFFVTVPTDDSFSPDTLFRAMDRVHRAIFVVIVLIRSNARLAKGFGKNDQDLAELVEEATAGTMVEAGA